MATSRRRLGGLIFSVLVLFCISSVARADVQFSGWSEVPGRSTTATSDAAVTYQNRLYLFGIGINDHGHYVNSFDGTQWAGWKPIPGGGTTNLPDAATVYNGKLYLFGIGIGDHAHYMNVFDGTQWAGWKLIPGGATTNLADTAAPFNGKLYLVGIGIGDHGHYMNVFDGMQWAGWKAIAGGGTNLSDTATLYGAELFLFGIGASDGRHYLNMAMNNKLVQVRIAGTQYFDFDPGDSGDHFNEQNGYMCVVHNPGCGWIGNSGLDKFFSVRKPLPQGAQLVRVDFLAYAPACLHSVDSGTIGGWGSYGAQIQDVTNVHWNNACQGVYGGKNVFYRISFVIFIPTGKNQ